MAVLDGIDPQVGIQPKNENALSGETRLDIEAGCGGAARRRRSRTEIDMESAD